MTATHAMRFLFGSSDSVSTFIMYQVHSLI
jgi:hypothetical protein